MNKTRWARILGDGLLYSGACLVSHIILYVDANNDYIDVYDGRDATSGKLFCRISTSTRTNKNTALAPPVPFDVGIYINAKDDAIATTVVFEPVAG